MIHLSSGCNTIWKTGYNHFMKSAEQIKKDWIDFSNAAYVEWRGPTRKTVTEFATEWLGLSKSLVSKQLMGVVPKDLRTISCWVKRYGPKIYDILDMEPPADSIEALPEPFRSISREIRETLAEYNVSGGTPEAERLAAEIMKKHGYQVKMTSESPRTKD